MNGKIFKRLPLILGAAALLALLAGCGSVSAEDNTDEASLSPVQESAELELVNAREEEPPCSASVRHLSGQAYVLRGSEKLALSADDPIFEGDSILTGKDSMVVLSLNGGKQIWIAAESHLDIAVLTESEEGEKTRLALKDGNVVSVIDERLEDGDSYDVETPGLVMAIRGTIASVSHDAAAGESSAAFFEGSGIVEARGGDEVMVVSLGERVGAAQGELVRGEIGMESLNEAERLFIFDGDYGNRQDREGIEKRLEALLGRQSFYGGGQPPTGAGGGSMPSGEPQYESGGDNGVNDAAFFAIKQEFIQAQKDYDQGLIDKDTFLSVKQRFIEAKEVYNSR